MTDRKGQQSQDGGANLPKSKFWKGPGEGTENSAKMVGPLSSGLVDQQQVFLLPGQNVIFDIRQSPAFRKYSICWAFKHSVVVFVFVFTLTVGIMCQRTVQPKQLSCVTKPATPP